MNNRKELEKKFQSYPDIINLSQMGEMLNLVNYKNTSRILKESSIRYFATDDNHLYNIVKKDVIEYLLSDAYERDQFRFPSLNNNGRKYLVIQVKHPELGLVYHKRSHGNCETKIGSYLTADIQFAKKYSLYYRAESRLLQMKKIYGDICEIIIKGGRT